MKRILLIPILFLLGCSSTTSPNPTPSADETAAAAQGTDAVQTTNDEAATLEMTVDGSDAVKPPGGSPTAAEVAAYMSTHVTQGMQPPTCSSSTVNGATVTYTYNDCTNARGTSHLTGTMTVVYSVDGAGIHAHATATGFAVNQSTLDIDATTTYTVGGGVKTMSVNTQSSGTGPLGNSISRTGSYTVTWSSSCHTMNGSWSSTSKGLTRTTTVSNLTRCRGFCPAAGGTVTHTFAGGKTLTLTYDGSAVLHWTDGTNSGTINLTCTPGS